jgi:hypothetical protein
MRRNKKHLHIDVLSKFQYTEHTLAMVSYTSQASAQQMAKDFTLFLVYDHRANSNLEKICKFLFQDLLQEEKNIFIEVV